MFSFKIMIIIKKGKEKLFFAVMKKSSAFFTEHLMGGHIFVI